MDTVKYDFSRLFRCMQRAERGEELTIGFFGGSITQGKSCYKTGIYLCISCVSVVAEEFSKGGISLCKRRKRIANIRLTRKERGRKMEKNNTFTQGKILKPLIMSRQPEAILFDIGLATPMSSALQIVLCLGCMLYLKKKQRV